MRSDEPTEAKLEGAEQALIGLATECWRFQRLFARALGKLDAGESLRFANQHRYFVQRVDECLATAGLKLVSLEGHPYDTGAAVTALNVGDFGAEDELVVEHMIEPIILGTSGLLKSGTVMLRKIEP
jgi:hypothetical protein